MSVKRRKDHQEVHETKTSSISSTPSLLSTFFDLLQLLTPYILHPIIFLSIYLPISWPLTTTFRPATSISDLTGKVILVTGGNTGLGRETILQLAQHNPKCIYMASRSASKALAAIREIKSQLRASNPSIVFLPLDLSNFSSVAAAADRFRAENQRLDILILNAGIMATPTSSLSTSGHDLQLATNHFGHFLLTKLLLPTLQYAASHPPSPTSVPDVRLVVVSSEAHHMSPSVSVITSPHLASLTPWTRYGASKAANILFASEFSHRHGDGAHKVDNVANIIAVSLHPGLIRTQLYQPSRADTGFIGGIMTLLGPLVMCDVQRGAWNQLWAATAPRAELENGAYYTPVGRKMQQQPSVNRWINDQEAARELWEWTEAELGKAGY